MKKGQINNILLAVLLVLNIRTVQGQEEKVVLGFGDFMNLVVENHPLTKAAQLQVESGMAEIRSKRGSFDPELFHQLNYKRYEGDLYYDLSQSGLRIPTWFGIDLEGGFQKNEGLYVNPENFLPAEGLIYAGLSVPVGQGLFIDQRRADLRKAQLYFQMSTAEQEIMINDLKLEAGKTYWDFYTAYKNLLIYEDALKLAQERFVAVQSGVIFGDRPALDSIEAGIQVQNRQISYLDAMLLYNNSKARLSIFLWKDGFIPIELAEGTIPSDNITDMAEQSLQFDDSLMNQHPILRQINLELASINIDKKLAKERLKPELNLKYNLLSTNAPNTGYFNPDFNNYSFGLEFKIPILLRKERGDLQLMKIKMDATRFKLKPKQADLNYKLIAARNEWNTTQDQIETTRKMISDYSRLLGGERQLFDAGESSLFLVNSREIGYIEAQKKLYKLIGKSQKSLLNISYSLGNLHSLEL